MLKNLEADLILTNGTVITIDPERPRAEAVALKHGRILAVGSVQDIHSLKGPRTEVIELKGKTVVPGFNDAHNHMASFGMQLQMVSLQSARAATVTDIVTAMRQRAETQEAGTWVKGAGYDNNKLPDGRHPTRWDLDRASSEHLLFARHTSGHMCVVNSRVLEHLGINRNTPDPAGGHIDRDEHGEQVSCRRTP